MQTLQSQLVQSGFISNNSLKTYDILPRMETLIQSCFNSNSSSTNTINHHNPKSLLIQTLRNFQKICLTSFEKSSIKLILINSLLNFCPLQLINEQFVDFLDSVCEQLLAQKQQLPQKRMHKSKSFMNKVSQGFSKISSMVSFDFEPSQNKKAQILLGEKTKQTSQIIDFHTRILQEYGVYLRKKLQDYRFFNKMRETHEKTKDITINTEDQLIQLRQEAWKIINLMSHHTVIISWFKRMAFSLLQHKPLIVSIIVTLCRDCLIFYPLIVKLVVVESQMLLDKYNLIIDKEKKRKSYVNNNTNRLLQQLSRDVIFVEVDNLLMQLTDINQTVFFLFCGRKHYSYIHFQTPKHFLLNISSPHLDPIYEILKTVKHTVQKQQKLKLYRTQQTILLDQTVSKVIEKIEKTKTISTIKDLLPMETKDTQRSNEDYSKNEPFKKKQKGVSSFQQQTQII